MQHLYPRRSLGQQLTDPAELERKAADIASKYTPRQRRQYLAVLPVTELGRAVFGVLTRMERARQDRKAGTR